MPQPFPKEFRCDVIAVARQGDKSIAQVARSFGISESCLSRWLKIADREDGLAGPTSSTPAGGGGDLEAENRELRKRTKQLEQENEILRRATSWPATYDSSSATGTRFSDPARSPSSTPRCRTSSAAQAGSPPRT